MYPRSKTTQTNARSRPLWRINMDQIEEKLIKEVLYAKYLLDSSFKALQTSDMTEDKDMPNASL